MSKFCKYCGSELSDSEQFCPNCGNRAESDFGNTVNNNQSSNQNNNSQYNNGNFNGNGNSNNPGTNENPFIMYYVDVFKNKYLLFDGRASRKEYWMFVLFQILVGIGVSIVDSIIGTDGVLYGLFTIGTFIPSLAIAIRRLHDIGKSGFWYLVCLIPLAGPIWLLVLLCTQSQYGGNEYGDMPRI